MLTAKAVREIRELRASGLRVVDIAAKFSITVSAVCQICLGTIHKDAPGPLTRSHADRRASLDQRLTGLVDRSAGPLGCHPFLGRRDEDGYGTISIDGGDYGVHRLVLSRKLGRPLDRAEVTRHTCNFPPCVNPLHLIPGSGLDNARDMVAAGRSLRGERSKQAKLTERQVLDIRALFASGNGASYEAVGRVYGISGKAVALIVNGQRWRHLALAPNSLDSSSSPPIGGAP